MNTVRWIPALTDEHIQQAVLTARAVVALDERLARALHNVAERDQKIADMERWRLQGAQERQRLIGRLGAVRNLHSERCEVACGDGCCHEGLGTCEYCDEPWPCATYRAADGTPEVAADAPPGGDGA